MASSFRALKNRNYRLYFIGQLVSVVGTAMQMMVQSWLVYRLSHSAAWLGAVMFFMQIPAFVTSPFAGAIADRHDRRRILIAVQTLSMLQAFILAALTFTGVVALWHIVVLSIFLGVLNGFEITTRHAFAVDLVGKADISSAISLNSAVINGSRVVGPALAGLLIEPLGETGCFFLNGLSFLAVIYGLWILKANQKRHAHTQSHLSEIAEAFAYVRRHPIIFPLISVVFTISLIGISYNVLLPVFAEKVLGGGVTTFAWLTSFGGLGAVLGAVVSGMQNRVENNHPRVLTYLALMGGALVVFGVSRELWVSLAALFVAGYFMMSTYPTINTSIQHIVEDSMRGRVLALYTMTIFAATPLGSLFAGWAADRVGAPLVTEVSGLLCVAVGSCSLAFMPRTGKKLA